MHARSTRHTTQAVERTQTVTSLFRNTDKNDVKHWTGAAAAGYFRVYLIFAIFLFDACAGREIQAHANYYNITKYS